MGVAGVMPALTSAVTSRALTSTWTRKRLHGSSSAIEPAVNPVSMRLSALPPACSARVDVRMQSSATWWFVRMSPLAEANVPVPPLEMRTTAPCTRATSAGVRRTP
jgi:hypothetical protein